MEHQTAALIQGLRDEVWGLKFTWEKDVALQEHYFVRLALMVQAMQKIAAAADQADLGTVKALAQRTLELDRELRG
jgi:hypothetical protein